MFLIPIANIDFFADKNKIFAHFFYNFAQQKL